MNENLIVKTKIKEIISDLKISEDFADTLSEVTRKIVIEAKNRADLNDRITLFARDIYLGKIQAKTELIVKSNIKLIVPKYDIAKDFYPALNEQIIWIITQAKARAIANGRKTVMSKDI